MSEKPPVARRRERRTTFHGRELDDPYAWLRDRDDPATLDHLKAENAYAEGVMRPSEERRRRLFSEMRGRILETDQSVPVQIDDWLYYTRTVEGLQYRIHCRRREATGAAEQVLVDGNRLIEGHAYFRLGTLTVSPDHRRMAYAIDLDGDEIYTLFVVDLDSGDVLDTLREVHDSVEWANDNETLIYTTLDQAHRPCRAWRHRVGEPQANDTKIHDEADERFFLSLFKTRSRRYLGLHLGSHTTSEIRLLDADHPEVEPWCFLPRKQGVEYDIDHGGDTFWVLTNEDALDFRLFSAPVADPARERWVERIPHEAGVKLDAIQAFRDHLVVMRRAGGLRGIRVHRLADWHAHDVAFDEPVHTVWSGPNPTFDVTRFRFVYSSPVTPSTVIDYDLETREREVKKVTPVLGGYDPAAYTCERVEARAPDGARVPVSIVYRRDRRRAGGNPLVLHGYGAYGYSLDPEFDSARVSLLDRGVVWAIAHVRGGGELGRGWYESGKLAGKMNTFHDFIACAERLIELGFTRPDRLAIRGGSAGGLLVGAVTNLRPDLFRAAVAKVPFVDVINTMSDPSLPLTVIEYEEWGNPTVPEDAARILAYSPYENVTRQAYPDLLVTAGLNDPRVGYWEPAKWAARLRELRTDDGLLLLKTQLGAGHSGPSGRYEWLEELAFEFAFLLDRLGVAEPEDPGVGGG